MDGGSMAGERNNGQSRASVRLGALITCLLIAVLAAPPSYGAASYETSVRPKTLPPALRSKGWRLLEVPGQATAEFSQEGPNRIEVRAENAVSFLYRSLDARSAAKHRLGWRWRLEQAVPPTDLSQSPGDDRSLAVHVIFPMDESELSFWQKMEMAMTRMVAPPLSGKVLTYVWGGTQSAGSMLANPFIESRGKIIVLRSGSAPVGRWFIEDVDYRKDFRAAFGYEPPAPTHIAISADSDDTGSRSLGVVADLLFKN